mmetsp:Transcript_4075/g.4718  ORF Transcript_4075/g.4718 Transcript_4075/m.4718 type:complete len:131 (-) Transcript_4075:265-657(-)
MMMSIRFVISFFLLLLSSVNSFTPTGRVISITKTETKTSKRLYSIPDDETEERPKKDADDDAPKMMAKNLGRGGEVSEVKFRDPAMIANTNPFKMSWWAYILVGYPVLLLMNDFLHFLPKEGPLAFLTKI